jgi:cell division septation protein DedD
MDRQKIFWVVLAVSVFVVVVLVVGVLLLRQKPMAALAAAPGTVSPLTDAGTQVYEYSRPAGAEAAPGGETETMHFVIGDTGEPAPEAAAAPATQGEPPVSAPAAKAAPAVAAAPAQKAPSAKPATKAPAAPAAPKGPEYWIQTGSYKSQTRAEELATMLEGKGLAGRVFSYSGGADTYFRVRVGPYRNKGEAEKFLSTVRQIQGLESSYISLVPRTGRVN